MVGDSAKPGKYMASAMFCYKQKYGLFAPFLKWLDAVKCRYCYSSW